MPVEVRCFLLRGSEDPQEVKKRLRRKHSGLLVQGVRPGRSANEFYYEMVAAQTVEAASSGNLLAQKPEIDLLLRLAGTAQIATAMAKEGTEKGRPFLLVVAGEAAAVREVSEEEGWERLGRAPLSEAELAMVEGAALLNALRS